MGDPETELLLSLVRTPSLSGEEEEAAKALFSWARETGLDVHMDETRVKIEVRGKEEGGPFLLFASHLDTVPARDGWSVDPFSGMIKHDRIFGRGAVDAKGPLSAMANALHRIKKSSRLKRGRLALLATYSEETRDSTMGRALERLGARPDAAVVGEPTGLKPCTAQKGLLLLEITWEGTEAHAAWADAEENSILKASRDMAGLLSLHLGRPHPLLGKVTVTPTVIQAGASRNTTPGYCRCVVDVRTTPNWKNEEILERLGGCLEHGEIRVLSDRIKATETPRGSRILEACRKVVPGAEPFGSPTASDWIFMKDLDCVKFGPGDSRLSHKPDEHLSLKEYKDSIVLYEKIAMEYLK